MRGRVVATAVLAAVLGTASADPRVPAGPSETLARAIELYDDKDYWSATVELEKVIQGGSRDDLANKQHAELVLAQSYFQLGFYAAAGVLGFSQIAQVPTHRYRGATLKWFAALSRIAPGFDGGLGAFTPTELDDASSHDEVDELRYLRGRLAFRAGDRAVGLEALGAVDPASPFYPRARLAIATDDVRYGARDAALEVLASVPAHSDASDRAALLTASIEHAQVHDADALASYAEVGGTLAKRAAWQASIVRLEKAGTMLGPLDRYALTVPLDPDGVDDDLLDAIVGHEVCGKATVSDALATIRTAAPAAARDLRALREDDSPAQLIELASGKGTSQLSLRVQALVTIALGTSDIRRALADKLESEYEAAALSKADRAWLETQAGREVGMVVKMRTALAQDGIAKLVRVRLEEVAVALDAIGASTVKLPTGKGGVAPSCP